MTQPFVHSRHRGRTTLTVGLLAAAFALTACGGSGAGAASAPSTTPAAQQGRGAAFGAAFPGANGQIAAINGRTLQVQSPQSGQVAVSWTAATTFSRTVPASGSAVTVGSCVDVRTDAPTSSSGGASPTDVTATSITVSSPVQGSCTSGRGGLGAGGAFGGPGFRAASRPSGFPSGAPSGFPSGRPGGRTGNGTGFARPVVGQVTAVHGAVLTVAAVDFAARGSSTGTPTTGATASTPVTVHTSATTTWLRTATGTGKDLAVGQCVTALGKADDTGAVSATAIASRPAQDGQCTNGFGFGRGGATSTGSP